MPSVRFPNFVLPSSQHAKAQTRLACVLPAGKAFAQATAVNELLSCRMHSQSLKLTFRRLVAIRQQGGLESSQREDARLLVWQRQVRLSDDRRGAGKESKGLTTAQRTAECEIFELDFCKISTLKGCRQRIR